MPSRRNQRGARLQGHRRAEGTSNFLAIVDGVGPGEGGPRRDAEVVHDAFFPEEGALCAVCDIAAPANDLAAIVDRAERRVVWLVFTAEELPPNEGER